MWKEVASFQVTFFTRGRLRIIVKPGRLLARTEPKLHEQFIRG